MEPAERARVQGLIVNKFRGDAALFADGVRILEVRGALPVLGVVPFLPNLSVPEEDAAVLEASWHPVRLPTAMIDIAVIRLPRIANFDDFSPLAAEASVRVRYVTSCASLGHPQAIILPGTKSTIADLVWLREQGLERAIKERADAGTVVVGICGGYQMLGESIHDPDGVESPQPDIAGLGLLPVQTIFEGNKATHQVEACLLGGPAWLATLQGQTVAGYEIHMGHTRSTQPWLTLARRGETPVALRDGAVDHTGRVWGCYLHGLFANTAFRHAWLSSLGWCIPAEGAPPVVGLQGALDALASQVAAHLDMARLEAIIWDD
jgi:adenosylcobyric acid synthase